MNEQSTDYSGLVRETVAFFSRRELLVPLLVDTAIFVALSTCTAGLLAGPLTLGLSTMAQQGVAGAPVSVGDSFKGFRSIGAALGVWLLIVLASTPILVGLALGWELYVFVPVVAFFFGWSFLVLADRPELGALGAVKASVRLALARPKDTLFVGVFALFGSVIVSWTVFGIIPLLAFALVMSALLYHRHENLLDAPANAAAGALPARSSFEENSHGR